MEQALEAGGDWGAPCGPVVAAGLGVELISEAAPAQDGRQAAIRSERRLLLSRSQIEIRRGSGVGGLDQQEAIARLPRWASPGAEDGPDSPPLAGGRKGNNAQGG